MAKNTRNRNKKVELFISFLMGLERHRSEIFKGLFKEAYATLSETSYLLPYKLQEYFEYELLVSKDYYS